MFSVCHIEHNYYQTSIHLEIVCWLPIRTLQFTPHVCPDLQWQPISRVIQIQMLLKRPQTLKVPNIHSYKVYDTIFSKSLRLGPKRNKMIRCGSSLLPTAMFTLLSYTVKRQKTLESYVITRMLPKLGPELLLEDDEGTGQQYLERKTVP